MLSSILWLLAVGTALVIPALILWGWVRYLRDHAPRTRASTLSMLGLSFSTLSALLALSTHLYARFVRNFPLHDPTLLRIYAAGCLLSSLGIAFGVGGAGHKGPLRWLSPVTAFGTLLFWLLALSSE